MKCQSCEMRCPEGEGDETTSGYFCWACMAGQSTAAAPVVETVQAQLVKRDALNECRVRAMKAFFKAAQQDGMDVKNADGMRVALAGYLGRMVNSRCDLSAGEWREAAEGINCCLLAW